MESYTGLEEDYFDVEFKGFDALEGNGDGDVIPSEGMYLGLDISETSTGVCLIENGVKTTSNISLGDENSKSPYREVLCRRQLRLELGKLISGKSFDVVIIEDAFQGPNPSTTRLLYALNTAVDEMILDGEISCNLFIRVNNKEWKSWLYGVDTSGETKGLKDKVRIERCLGLLGITETGEGYQDRLDATGLLVGYFLNELEVKDKMQRKTHKKVSFSDIEYAYDVDSGCILSEYSYLEDLDWEFVGERSWSKGKMQEYLTDDPTKVYVTKGYVKLGRIADSLGLPYIDGGGVFAFWVKKNRLSKYKEVL